ncbi:uncharacterized protein [Triticum aestivum]|uniref:uncharacterized protein isoform X2 n=1 Tax=Triticum aestivum TaxID=4565 RepID=UPI001D0234CF|nr:uncharacterized protein LOC123045065 isoform X2 [Triticum aestivum]
MLQSNQAVAEVSKIASSLLPFGEEEPDKGEPVTGGTEEVLVFVKHISTRPETWLDFPLFINERYADAKLVILANNCLRSASLRLSIVLCWRRSLSTTTMETMLIWELRVVNTSNSAA